MHFWFPVIETLFKIAETLRYALAHIAEKKIYACELVSRLDPEVYMMSLELCAGLILPRLSSFIIQMATRQ